MSNPAQNHNGCSANLLQADNSRQPWVLRRNSKGSSMTINIRRFRNRLWRKFAWVPERLAQLLANLRPEGRDLGLQQVCPSCGLITPRHKRCCLECGKSLKPA
jgi:hypothetical protein